MGDPLTATAATSAAGLGVSLLGSALKGGAEQNALEARAQADRENQQLAMAQATNALERGQAEGNALRLKGDQTTGSARVAYGGGGVDANTGTAAEIQAQTTGLSELDARMTQVNARRQAWGYQVESMQYGREAQIAEQGKGEALAGSALGGVGQLGAGVSRLFAAGKPDLEG